MLAEFLALNGFDVFMANGRGNKFTKRGEAVADEWKFSLDEGVLDVQAVVDEVKY